VSPDEAIAAIRTRSERGYTMFDTYIDGFNAAADDVEACLAVLVHEQNVAVEAIAALYERVHRGGPWPLLPHLDQYMTPEAAALVRGVVAGLGDDHG
jgi:hypothetical protein